jgi:anaerobic selenocysteine-containing dehydrogenase
MAAVEEFDNPIPVWQGTATLEKESPEYDLYAVNWNGAINVMGMVMDDHWKHLYMDYYDPYLFNIWINADTAATKGLMDGDWAYVESRAGSVKGKVKTSQLIHPECVGIGGRFGTRSLNAAPHTRAEGSMCFNDLIPSDEESLDPISGNVEGSPKVKIYKA